MHQQTYCNVEHIVIDGASDDGTLELLEEYRKNKWIQYYSEPDKGSYDAMNKGIEKACGKYVVFLNSDDYFYDKFAISKSVGRLEKEHTDFSCAYGHYIVDGKAVAFINCQPEAFFLRTPFSHKTMFTRRDVLLKEEGFDCSKYKSAADYDLIVRLLMKGYTCSIVRHVVACFRAGGYADSDTETSRTECNLIQQRHFSEITCERVAEGKTYGALRDIFKGSRAASFLILLFYKEQFCNKSSKIVISMIKSSLTFF